MKGLFFLAGWLRFSKRHRLARGKRTKKTTCIVFNKLARAILSFLSRTGYERNTCIQSVCCIPVCLLALVPPHLSPDSAAGPCGVCAGQPEEALTGLLACRWCQVTRAGAAGLRWRLVAAEPWGLAGLFPKCDTNILRGKSLKLNMQHPGFRSAL